MNAAPSYAWAASSIGSLPIVTSLGFGVGVGLWVAAGALLTLGLFTATILTVRSIARPRPLDARKEEER